jgi:hypothetical protein
VCTTQPRIQCVRGVLFLEGKRHLRREAEVRMRGDILQAPVYIVMIYGCEYRRIINWEECGRKWLGLLLETVSQPVPGRTDKTESSRSLGRDLNPRFPECDAGVLTIIPRCSVAHS